MSKILHLTTGFGGEYTVVKSVHNYLIEKGFSSRILSFLGEKEDETLKAKKFIGEFLINFSSIKRLVEEIKSSDVVIYNCFYNFESVLLIFLIKKLYKKKLMLISHVNTFQFGSRLSEVGMDLRRYVVWNWANFFADKFIFITQDQKNQYLKFIWNKKKIESKSVLIPNMIGTKYYENKIKRDYKGKKKFDILFVGRFEKNKGYFDLLEVGKELPENITIKLAGGTEDTGLKQVKVLGFVPNDKLRDEFDKCDLFILPSYTEVFPTTIIESMARSMPIITTDINGLNEIVIDGVNGFIIKPGDVKGLLVLLKTLPEKTDLLNQMAINNLKKSENYTADKIGLMYKEAITSLFQ